MGSGAKPPEAESFLRIGHPKEGANWPHVHVLNERKVIFLKGALGEGNWTILDAPEATNIRLLHTKGIKLIPPPLWHGTYCDRQTDGHYRSNSPRS